MGRVIKFKSSLVSRREVAFCGCPECGGEVQGNLGGIYFNRIITVQQLVRGTCQNCGRYWMELYHTFSWSKKIENISKGFPILINNKGHIISEWRFGYPIENDKLFAETVVKIRTEVLKELQSVANKSSPKKLNCDRNK